MTLIFCCALLLSLASLGWAIRRSRLLSLLSNVAAVLFVFLLPQRLIRGYDLGTLIVVLPIAVCCWALLELLFRRAGSGPSPDEERPSSRRQISLRTMAFAFTAVAIGLGLMSVAKAWNAPREIVGRFVDQATGEGVANVAIWAHPMGSAKATPSSTAEPRTVVTRLTEKGLHPNYIVLRPGDTLVFKNESQGGTAPHFSFNRNLMYTPTVAKGEEFSMTLPKSEIVPTRFGCGIRSDWYGYVFVTHTPVAVSDENGVWRLPNLPPGRHTVRVWHERNGYIRQATLDNGRIVIDQTPKSKGYTLDIELMTRDIGECTLKTEDGIPLRN